MRAKKSLGQNFLVDEAVKENILAAVSLRAGETIVEIGPGTGVLTEHLAESGADVIAVELDDRLIPVLEEKFADSENVCVVHEDVLEVDIEEIIKEVRKYRVVGNLPYYIASAVIRKFLESSIPPVEMFVMVQREVAERICAKPGEMSVLAVAVQYFAEPEMLFVVPSEAFDPRPKVESAFLRMGSKKQEAGSGKGKENRRQFFRLVKMGFSARRKTLANNLSAGLQLPKAKIEEILREAGIGEKARAQDLGVEEWQTLDRIFEGVLQFSLYPKEGE